MKNPPAPAVENASKRLGDHIRIARLRRNLSMTDLGNKIGVHRNIISLAESGKLGTSIGVYLSILWALDMLDHIFDVASPTNDILGQRLELSNMRKRARPNVG